MVARRGLHCHSPSGSCLKWITTRRTQFEQNESGSTRNDGHVSDTPDRPIGSACAGLRAAYVKLAQAQSKVNSAHSSPCASNVCIVSARDVACCAVHFASGAMAAEGRPGAKGRGAEERVRGLIG